MLSDRTLDYAEDLTGMLLGVDRLVRRDGGDEDDGLVVVNMDPDRSPTPYASFEDAEAALHELKRRALDLPEPDRRKYYEQVCDSTRTLLRWRQGRLDFAEQISGFL